jgi:predicted phosphodiesterase
MKLDIRLRIHATYMRIGIISDVHANLPALEAVLKKLDELKVETVYCLGDTVGYGPFPNECLTLVRERCSIILKGNHDSGLIGESPLTEFNQYGAQAIVWAQKVVEEYHVAFLRTLDYTRLVDQITLAHASPARPEEWTYVLTVRAAREAFKASQTPLCFIGHTHVPVIIGEDTTVNVYEPGKRFVINVGSVGQPRDGNANSAFGFYDSEADSYELVRVPYDIQRTARAIEDAGLPKFLAMRLFQGI